MRFLYFFLTIVWIGLGNARAASIAEAVFRIPYQTELSEINPLNLRSASGSYIHQALFRNLFWINEKNELKNDLSEKCFWKKPTLFHCLLKKNLKWSDGRLISAKDFLDTYEFVLNPKSSFTRKEMLFSIKAARSFANGETTEFSKVGIRTPDERTLEFELAEQDPEFEYKLAMPMIAPVRQKNFNVGQPIFSTGPYRIKSYDTKTLELRMESNPNYSLAGLRPDLVFVYISDDSVQIPLFSKNEIDLVRRVPTAQIPLWKKDVSFRGIEVMRFDYFGFNLEKIDQAARQALTDVIDYDEWQKLLNSSGRPGCFEFSHQAIDSPICYPFIKKKQSITFKDPKQRLEVVFSQLGGEDHQRTGEWLKAQWKSYLNIDVTVKQLENKVFIAILKSNLPSLYRKGVPLETPLCYSAVKLFEPGNPENLNKITDAFLTKKIAQLKKELKLKKQKALCLEILNHIKKNALIIPTGRYELSILLREKFNKLKINKLNMIDFSQF